MVTPVLRLLKRDGYHVTVNCSEYSKAIYENNPNIDEFIVHKTDSIPQMDLPKHWENLSVGFDKVVNLTGSIEMGLLKVEGSPEFNWSHDRRHAECNVNYYDRTLELAGFSERGLNGELYFTPEEEEWAVHNSFKGRFNVLWSLSGSSFHKVYHRAEAVARAILEKYHDVRITTVGDDFCHLLEWIHKRARLKCGIWKIRQSLAMVKHSDLVVGAETGILNAAGCYDVPKIVLLSHSSEENLSKYWKNCQSISSSPACYPCHQLHYTLKSCPTDVVYEQDELDKKRYVAVEYPKCMAQLEEQKLYNAIEKVYLDWKSKRSTEWHHPQPQLQLR